MTIAGSCLSPNWTVRKRPPLQAQIPFPCRGRERNPHLPASSLPKAGPTGTTAAALQPKCFQLPAPGLGTPGHIQPSHTQSCSPELLNIVLKTSPHSHIISAGYLAFHSFTYLIKNTPSHPCLAPPWTLFLAAAPNRYFLKKGKKDIPTLTAIHCSPLFVVQRIGSFIG